VKTYDTEGRRTRRERLNAAEGKDRTRFRYSIGNVRPRDCQKCPLLSIGVVRPLWVIKTIKKSTGGVSPENYLSIRLLKRLWPETCVAKTNEYLDSAFSRIRDLVLDVRFCFLCFKNV